MNKVYIAGPITNCEDYYEIFSQREKELVYMGYKVVNPAERGEVLKKQLGREPSHKEYMNYLLPMLLNCDHISLLPGWEKSKGAKIEYDVALATGKTIIDVKVIS